MMGTTDNPKTAAERRKQAKRKIAILLAKLERLSNDLGKCSQDMEAVKAVVGGEEDGRYDDVDSHPGSLDLPQSLARGKR
jgi:hypothetical protein